MEKKTKVPMMLRILVIIFFIEIIGWMINIIAAPQYATSLNEQSDLIEPQAVQGVGKQFFSEDSFTSENEMKLQLETEFVRNAIDENKLYLLAQLMTAEAGGTGDKQELLFVGKVALNREKSKSYDFKNVNTLEAVIAQENQYPETWVKIQNGIEPTALALEAARELLDGTITKLYYNGIEFTDDILWQTGFLPEWEGNELVFKTKYHYYSKQAD